MAEACGLLPEQRAKISLKLRTREQILADWNRTKGDKLAAARRALAGAVSSKNAVAEAKAREELEALEKDKAENAAKADAAILGVLTTQQKVTWESYKLFKDLTALFRNARLTEEQLPKIRRICGDASGQPQKFKVDAQTLEQARKDRLERCFNRVMETVLTPEQRQAMGSETPAKKADEPKTTGKTTPKKGR
jgi:Spy/CpxP family protein refolding chaperone